MSPNSRSHEFLMYFVRYHNLIIFRVQNYTLFVNAAILKNYDFIIASNATFFYHQNCMNTVMLPHRSVLYRNWFTLFPNQFQYKTFLLKNNMKKTCYLKQRRKITSQI